VNRYSAGKIARKRILLGIGVAVTMLMAACSSPRTPISVAISTAPPASLNVNQTASIVATLTNDSSNAGVNWSCAPAGSCGTFSPTHTASGAATTYTAPASAASVTITATSAADATKTASATVNVTTPPISISISTAPPSSLNVNQTASVAATVTNDSSSNGGVDWSCAPVGSCGSFSPTHTASGATTTYTAPASAASVTITATSTADSTKTATASVTITPLPISISITTAPPATAYINQTAPVAATVVNDTSNSGVDWSCAPAGSCGAFSPTHTASGVATTYTAPASATSVTITATSTADTTKTATAAVNVVPLSVSSLAGTYTFYAAGFDSNSAPSQVAGSIVLDGNGNVTGGEQDRADPNASPNVQADDPITGGTVTDGSNGEATITMTATSWGTETFSVTLVNGKHLLITEFDANTNSQGSMDLQTAPTSVPMGGNAFALNDYEDEFSFGGVITSDGTNITAGDADDNSGSANLDFNPSVSNAITAPDASGRGTIQLYDQSMGGPIQFAYYVVGPEAFRLVEIDANDYLVGSMLGQGTAAGSFSAASLSGGFAFEQVGWTGPAYFAVAGQFATDGVSAFSSGQMDVNDGDDPPYLAADISGSTYGVTSDGYGSIALSPTNGSYLANFGVYAVDPAINIADPNSSTGGGGALLLELDPSNQGAGPGAGFAVPQQLSGATFSGNYAFNLGDGYTTNPSFEWFDLIGQLVSDGVSNLTGTADFNSASGGVQVAGAPVTGTFAADGSHAGRFTAAVTVNGSILPNNVTGYQASSSLLLQVDVDPQPTDSFTTVAVGVLEQQQ
jgi:hypothetical protein